MTKHERLMGSSLKCHRMLDIANIRLWNPEEDDFEPDVTQSLTIIWNTSWW